MSKLNTFAAVRQLKGWHAVAFAATLIERMAPNYTLFCESTGYAEVSQFRNVLNAVWEWLSVPKMKINLAVQLERIEDVTPHPSEYDSYGVYPAIDAAVSLSSTLLLMQGEDPQGAVVVSKLSQGAVESFIEATSEVALDSEGIKAHPLMQWEIEFQQELLTLLAQMKGGREDVATLKALATQEGVSNLGIECDPS
ncbi:YjaG family protein [Aestuariibacter halophilus]|uniref:YjaG family protein n=1 Tax=Fluctibacter halophilus TaxID=226011 RepID=A0ABS8G9B4_9ALTE|nr:YjaG family protein [Aestuariibacter halophilus]MCC2617162.1 YjaG family protein [Aestuariibacter halophilus]